MAVMFWMITLRVYPAPAHWSMVRFPPRLDEYLSLVLPLVKQWLHQQARARLDEIPFNRTRHFRDSRPVTAGMAVPKSAGETVADTFGGSHGQPGGARGALRGTSHLPRRRGASTAAWRLRGGATHGWWHGLAHRARFPDAVLRVGLRGPTSHAGLAPQAAALHQRGHDARLGFVGSKVSHALASFQLGRRLVHGRREDDSVGRARSLRRCCRWRWHARVETVALACELPR